MYLWWCTLALECEKQGRSYHHSNMSIQLVIGTDKVAGLRVKIGGRARDQEVQGVKSKKQGYLFYSTTDMGIYMSRLPSQQD